MKPLSVIACFALLSAACVPNDSPIRILGAHQLKPGTTTCEADSIQLLRGSLDISAVQTYLIQFDLASDLQQLSTTVGGEVLAGPDRNDFFAKEMVFSYSSVPTRPFDPAERIPVHMVIPAGAAPGDSFIITDLFTQKATERLIANVAPGDNIEVAATFELRGELASGAALRSNPVTYPIRVFNSAFPGCAPITPAGGGTPIPNPRALNGPCGLPGGQDGTQPGCCLIPDADGGIPNPEFKDSCASGA